MGQWPVAYTGTTCGGGRKKLYMDLQMHRTHTSSPLAILPLLWLQLAGIALVEARPVRQPI
eukprot:9588736-Karenia_brevis.AAC.1